jgi:hypothetical protein
MYFKLPENAKTRLEIGVHMTLYQTLTHNDQLSLSER